jgi:hypothetical protein
MSGRIVGEVLDYAPADLRTAELLTLIAIAEDARDRDRLARNSDLQTLIKRTRLAPGTVRNALSELTRRALLIPQHKRVHKGGIHQEYRIPDLLEHHRRATIRPVNESLHNDTMEQKRVTP